MGGSWLWDLSCLWLTGDGSFCWGGRLLAFGELAENMIPLVFFFFLVTMQFLVSRGFNLVNFSFGALMHWVGRSETVRRG